MIKRRKDGGFTLIELMIVIAVIGILAIVLVPKMAGIKTGAKNVGVVTNVKSVQAYATANIDKWITGKKSESDVEKEIYAQYNGKVNDTTDDDNALQNPFSGKILVTSVITNAVTDNATLATDGALVILSDADLSTTNDAKGSVVVNIKDFATKGIQIAGYDQDGKIVDSVIKIKP